MTGGHRGPGRMWLADLAIRQPIFISMVVVAVLVVGGLLYTRLGVDLFPDVSLPVVAVTVPYPGADPSSVDREVVRPIEEAVAPLAGVEQIRSTSMESVAIVVVQFELDRDAGEAEREVRARVDAVRATLPSDAREPLVQRFDPTAAPILTVALTAREGQDAATLRRMAEDEIAPALARIDGVGAANVRGGETRRVEVRLQREKLAALGVPVQQVAGAIRGENLSVPAGTAREGDRQVLVGTTGAYRSLDDLRRTAVAAGPNGIVTVGDIATVTEAAPDPTEDYRVDGERAVIIEVLRQSGSNTVRVAEAVKSELERIEAEHGVRARVVTDESAFTREAVEDLQLALVLGAILAALVVLVFFRDLRNTLVTVAGLPVILLGTFGALQLLGMSLNLVTLMALSLSIGVLIDDAIVVRENIFRHMESGEDPRRASGRGTAEIALAVLAVSSTIVAMFLPIAFTEGIAGKFLRDFGLTVAIAVVISLVEAYTLAPMLSAYLFHRTGHRVRGEALGPVNRAYRRILGWSLRHRLVVVGLGLAAFAGSLAVVPSMQTSFVPDIDQGRFSVSLELPAGTPIERTRERVTAVEAVLSDDPTVEQVYSQVGIGGATERARIQVRLRARGDTQDIAARLRRDVSTAAGDARASVDVSSVGTIFGNTSAIEAVRGRPIQFSVVGEDPDAVGRVSRELQERLASVSGAIDVERSVRPPRPALRVALDRDKPAAAGLSTAQVGLTMRALLSGERASVYRGGAEPIDIVVLLDPAAARDLAGLEQLPIATPRGPVRLGDVARLERVNETPRIERVNGRSEVLVGAGHLGRDQGVVLADARREADAIALPAGVEIELSGQSRYVDEAFGQLLFAMGLGILFVYMILASQFASLAHPVTIMLALPLSAVGALLALFAVGASIDMLVLIGVILLLGLVAKNSILLVDVTDRLRREGIAREAALLRAGPLRLRPILMTTLAMIFGMLPAALGIGAGAELRQNMAIAVIAGLTTSTLLTLVVVPVAYTYVDDVQLHLLNLFRRTAPAAPSALDGDGEPRDVPIERVTTQVVASGTPHQADGRRWPGEVAAGLLAAGVGIGVALGELARRRPGRRR